MSSLKANDEQNWLVLIHLSVLLGLSVLPIVGWFVPFVLWLLKKDQSNYIDKGSRDLFNFLLNLLVFSAIGSLLVVIGIGLLILALNYIAAICLPIYAAYRTSKGHVYRYPSFIHFLHL